MTGEPTTLTMERHSATVRPGSDNARMTTIMQNYGLTWTDLDGTPRATVTAYDKPSAQHRKDQLESAGASDIEIHSVRLGEQLEPKA